MKLTELARKVIIKHPVDPNNVNIEKDPFHPTAYVITLPLDAEPSYIWLTLFEQVLWSSLDFWDRKILIVGTDLKLATTPEGVAEKLHWLETIVTATNKRVDEYNKNVNAARKAETTKMLDDAAVRKDISTWSSGRVIG